MTRLRALTLRTAMLALTSVLLAVAPASASASPRYDVPQGFTRCTQAHAWDGFFKWASQRHASCAKSAAFMRDYATHATGASMPKRVDGYACRIHYWRNDDGDVYASRHTCQRGDVTIRFYGMV